MLNFPGGLDEETRQKIGLEIDMLGIKSAEVKGRELVCIEFLNPFFETGTKIKWAHHLIGQASSMW